MRTLLLLLFSTLVFFSCRDGSEPRVVTPGLELTKEVPEWVTENKLLLPGSIIYKSGDRFVLKTLQEAAAISEFYENRMKALGFSRAVNLKQGDDFLQQFEKDSETITIEIDKIEYSSSHLIRLGHSKVDYSKSSIGENERKR